MKENNDPSISAALRAARVTPALPPRFQQNVWRRIEDAESPSAPASWLEALANLVLRPRFAVVAIAVLVLTGIFAGTLDGWQMARHAAQMNYLAAVAPHAAR